MKYKKTFFWIVTFVLILTMVFALCACSEDTATETPEGDVNQGTDQGDNGQTDQGDNGQPEQGDEDPVEDPVDPDLIDVALLAYELNEETDTYTVVGIGDGVGTKLVIPEEYNGKSVTSIEYSAFWGCTSLTSVTIGNGVTSIGRCAFNRCTSLSSLTIPDSVTSIGDDAFMDCTSLTSVTIGNGVTSIGSSAFAFCTSLTSVTIPDSVTSIGCNPFRNTPLTSVYYTGDIASWCGITFDMESGNPLCYAHNLYIGNVLVTDLVIPNGVTEIKYSAFEGATCLTSVTIPDSVTSIGRNAFSGCTNLQYNKYGNVYYLGNETNPYLALIKATTSITSCAIHENTKVIAYGAFYDCTSLTSITIPDSVTSIGRYAFYNCTSLNRVTIGSGVMSIGWHAFSGCTSLNRVTIGSGLTEIGERAFSGCTFLTRITYQGTKEQWNAIDKVRDWDSQTGRYVIYCENGTINK